mmetsp:Transcript_28541/g.82048  ORF Transcript_28541/g.82048 Transcript_28541/m.82048 type:complete len:233 (+) Transcript_28541:749-1447(+)
MRTSGTTGPISSTSWARRTSTYAAAACTNPWTPRRSPPTPRCRRPLLALRRRRCGPSGLRRRPRPAGVGPWPRRRCSSPSSRSAHLSCAGSSCMPGEVMATTRMALRGDSSAASPRRRGGCAAIWPSAPAPWVAGTVRSSTARLATPSSHGVPTDVAHSSNTETGTFLTPRASIFSIICWIAFRGRLCQTHQPKRRCGSSSCSSGRPMESRGAGKLRDSPAGWRRSRSGRRL